MSTAGDYPLTLQYSLVGAGRRLLGLGLAGDLLGYGMAAAVGLVSAWRIWTWRAHPVRALAVGLCAASLVNPHLHPYDVTGGIFAVAALLGASTQRWRGWLALVLHHGGQLAEGTSGSGLAVAPATVGLFAAWVLLVTAPLPPGRAVDPPAP